MNRLTGRNEKGDLLLCGEYVYGNNQDIYNAVSLLEEYEDTGLEPEEIKELVRAYNKESTKCAHYEQLEEQGLLIKLPCKVGSDVYLIHNICNGKWTSIEKVKFKINLYNYFGKTVFLTREEAEKALKEMEGKQ